MSLKEFIKERKNVINEWNEQDSVTMKHPKGFKFDVIFEPKLDVTKVRLHNREMSTAQFTGKLKKKDLLKDVENFWKTVK
jgi:hypothetical protein